MRITRLSYVAVLCATVMVGFGIGGTEDTAEALGNPSSPSLRYELQTYSPGDTPEETWQILQEAIDQAAPGDVIELEPGVYDIGAHKLVIDKALTLRGPQPTELIRDPETGAVVSGEWGAKLTGAGAPLGTWLPVFGFDPVLLVEVRVHDGGTVAFDKLEIEYRHGYGLMHLGETPEACYPGNLAGCTGGSGPLVFSTSKCTSSNSNPAMWHNSCVYSGFGGDMTIRVEDSVILTEDTLGWINSDPLFLVGAFFDDVVIEKSSVMTRGSENSFSNCMEVVSSLDPEGRRAITIEDNVLESDSGTCIWALENEAAFRIEGNTVRVQSPYGGSALRLSTTNPNESTITENRMIMDGGGAAIYLGEIYDAIDRAENVVVSENVISGHATGGIVLDNYTQDALVEENVFALQPRVPNPSHNESCTPGLEGALFSDPVVEAPLLDPGQYGQAFRFDGQTGVIVPAGEGSDLNLTADLTVSAWIKPSGVVQEYTTVVAKPVASQQFPFSRFSMYFMEFSTKVGFHIGDGSDWYFGVEAEEPLPLNQWTHVAGVYDWSNQDDAGNADPLVRIYVNGTEVDVLRLLDEVPDATLEELAITYEPGDLGVPLGVGENGLGGAWYQGHLDDVAIWGEVRSAEEIAALAAGTTRPSDYPTGLVLHLPMETVSVGPNPDFPTLDIQETDGTGHDGIVNGVACPDPYQPEYLPGNHVWIHENATRITVRGNELSGVLDVAGPPGDPIDYEVYGPFSMIECHGSGNTFEENTYPDTPPPGFETEHDEDGNVRVIGDYGHIWLGPSAMHNTVSEKELEHLPNACAQVLDVPEGYPAISAWFWAVDEQGNPLYPIYEEPWFYFNFSDAGHDRDNDGKEIVSQARYFDRAGPFTGAISYDFWATWEEGAFSLPATEELVDGLYPAPWGTPVTLPDKNSVPLLDECQ